MDRILSNLNTECNILITLYFENKCNFLYNCQANICIPVNIYITYKNSKYILKIKICNKVSTHKIYHTHFFI